MIYCVLMNPTIDKIVKINNFNPGGTYKINELYEFPVGKAISVALTLNELGENVSVIAFIGEEDLKNYQNFLNSKNIRCTLIPIKGNVGNTRSNITIIDKTKNISTHLRFPGFSVNENDISEINSKIFDMINPNDFVIYSGSFPLGVPTSYISEIAKIIQEKNVKIIIDTSGPFLNQLKKFNPFLIKVNIEELEQLLKIKIIKNQDITEKPSEQLIIKLFEQMKILMKYSDHIILTLGKYGSLYLNNEIKIYAYLDLENVSYTVGCGDAYLGGLVYGFININKKEKLKDITDIIKLATACGSANTQILGAGILEKGNVWKFFDDVKITKFL